ncbi:hypothetical protein DMA11_19485 [Marinilabiliaceae bacterium JC017]|nr:hypothetical protein DMA11_19485 [Marinilabiliaceae bacterium JC017]
MQIKGEHGREKTRDSVKMIATVEYYAIDKSLKRPIKRRGVLRRSHLLKTNLNQKTSLLIKTTVLPINHMPIN